MAYGAITLDTSVFDEKGLRLESGLLKALEQFKGRQARLVLSEIVAKEVHAHLRDKAKEARALAIKALRKCSEDFAISNDGFYPLLQKAQKLRRHSRSGANPQL